MSARTSYFRGDPIWGEIPVVSSKRSGLELETPLKRMCERRQPPPPVEETPPQERQHDEEIDQETISRMMRELRSRGGKAQVRPVVDESPGSQLARKRWEKTTAEERSEVARKMNEVRNAGLTPEERSEKARKAVQERWKKVKASKKVATKENGFEESS